MNENFYNQILQILTEARSKVYHNVNFTMVEAYWHVGKMIVEEQGGVEAMSTARNSSRNLL